MVNRSGVRHNNLVDRVIQGEGRQRVTTILKTRYVYLACPWGPWGGGMYKVVDYLVQSQHEIDGAPRFRVVSSRGRRLITMPIVMLIAIVRVFYGAASGRMALLHVNLALGISVLRKLILVYAASLAGAPTVVHIHAANLQFYDRMPQKLRWFVRRAFRRTNCVIVLGENARSFVINTLGVEAERVVKLTNGVPKPVIAPVARLEDEPFRLLFLGSQFERKGLSDLLAALARPELLRLNWQLTIAGGGRRKGDEAQQFRERARDLGLESRVRFVGWIEQLRVSDLLARSDALILPSYEEGLPLVILEALGHGVPVICTPVGEIPQFLTDRKTALFVTPGQREELARALAEVIESPKLCTELAEAGRSHFQAHFSHKAFTRNLVSIYQRYCGLSASDCARQPSAPLLESNEIHVVRDTLELRGRGST
jgi:glycosyltransferase involved in cell wall biosynthesis